MVDCRETGPELHSALTGFVNCLLQGQIHLQVSPVLFGGNLIALEKKSGGVRPIAIGYTLLGGPALTVAADIDYIRDQQEHTGLRINTTKCEIICRGNIPRATQFDGFISLAPDEAELLGAPLFTGRKMDALLAERCAELTTAIGRLS